jgi:hypothetical protein
VSASDADPSAAPQAKQKRLRSGISAEQDGHLIIETQLYHRRDAYSGGRLDD